MKFSRLLLLASPLLLLACASSGPVTDYMDRDGYSVQIAPGGRYANPDIVRVVSQDRFKNMLLVKREAGSEPNAHPYRLDRDALVNTLKPLRVSASGGKPEMLFDKDRPEELKELVTLLADALVQAGPDEDVLFHFPTSRGFGLLRENVMLGGRAFVAGNQLNVVFANVHESYEGQWLRAGILRIFPVATRAEVRLRSRALVKGENLQVVRPDWLRVDLTPVATTPAKSTLVPPAPAAPAASVGERLQKLQQLKDKGLITDEEYQTKRKQLLDQL